MRVLGADASSLFLVDEATNKVVVQAAAGYQKPLVARRATYDLGEGITGWIAKEGRAVRAKTLDELHEHPAWIGKQTPLQGGREPNSFLGLPLPCLRPGHRSGQSHRRAQGGEYRPLPQPSRALLHGPG